MQLEKNKRQNEEVYEKVKKKKGEGGKKSQGEQYLSVQFPLSG